MSRPCAPESGFVLPSVLAYIAAAMLIVVVGATALERARDATVARPTFRKIKTTGMRNMVSYKMRVTKA